MIDNNVKIIKHKVGLFNLAEELGNVSKACKVMGLSRVLHKDMGTALIGSRQYYCTICSSLFSGVRSSSYNLEKYSFQENLLAARRQPGYC